jgi:quinol monooxygenase YgiN
MSSYGYISKMTAQAGKLDELASLLREAADLLKVNPSCISYIVSKDLDDRFVVVVEVWNDKESHDLSLREENVQELIMAALPLLATKPEVLVETTILGGRGDGL